MKTLPAILCCTALITSVDPLPEERLRSGDHKTLGKAFAAYIEARTLRQGLDEAEQDVIGVLEKAAKKAKVDDPLALVEDIEVSLFLAKDLSDKGIRKGRVQDYEKEIFEGRSNQRTLEYAIWTPKSYKASSTKWPLVLCFPDLPEEDMTPKAHIDRCWVDGDLRKGAIVACAAMPADTDKWGQLGDDYEGGLATMMMLLGTMLEKYAVDVERVFIAGRGHGVSAAVELASLYPTRFAGVIGRAGDMGETSPVNLRHVASLFAGGGANCTAYATRANELGWNNCTIDTGADEKAVWEWIKGIERNANPTTVTLSPITNVSTKAYWIQLDRFTVGAASRLDASIDRETNTVTLDSTGIEAVTLYFNDLLVDMDQPVRVICNGVEHEAKFPRRLQTLLDQAYRSGDPGRVYVNYEGYDLSNTTEDEGAGR